MNADTTKAKHEYKAVLIAHGRTLNRHAPNWTAHLDTLEHWLQHELSRPRDYIGASCTRKECDI